MCFGSIKLAPLNSTAAANDCYCCSDINILIDAGHLLYIPITIIGTFAYLVSQYIEAGTT